MLKKEKTCSWQRRDPLAAGLIFCLLLLLGLSCVLVWQCPFGETSHSKRGNPNQFFQRTFASFRRWEAGILNRLSPTKDKRIQVVTFSPDGKQIITTSEACKARIWDAQTGRLLNGSSTNRVAVMQVSFSPDGKQIVTSTQNGRLRVWDLRNPAQ